MGHFGSKKDIEDWEDRYDKKEVKKDLNDWKDTEEVAEGDEKITYFELDNDDGEENMMWVERKNFEELSDKVERYEKTMRLVSDLDLINNQVSLTCYAESRGGDKIRVNLVDLFQRALEGKECEIPEDVRYECGKCNDVGYYYDHKTRVRRKKNGPWEVKKVYCLSCDAWRKDPQEDLMWCPRCNEPQVSRQHINAIMPFFFCQKCGEITRETEQKEG